MKVPAGLVSSEASPWLADGHYLAVSSQGLFSVHIHPLVSLLFMKIPVLLD
jgi:hypothetical protein